MTLSFDNTFAHELIGFYQHQKPQVTANATLVFCNQKLAECLGIDLNLEKERQNWIDFLSGAKIPPGAEPIAQVYAGHQFGQFSPQLGDGRAVVLGELLDPQGNRFDIALKGSGRTAFSRNGDGKAALAPMLREALISEAMQALGIATTRTLAVVQTPETIVRQKHHPGAILTRVAASHIRIGTFEFFASRQEQDKVSRLIDYTIKRHHPSLAQSENKALALLNATADGLAELIANWMSIGFIHGVMNTDNMSMAGETLDYGPCAFMDSFHPKTVFSSIDHQGRYAYSNQPAIGQWNLARLAEAILPHIDNDKDKAIQKATSSINNYGKKFKRIWQIKMLAKLGINKEEQTNIDLLEDWLSLLQAQKIDFTNAFVALTDAADGDAAGIMGISSNKEAMQAWLARWQTARLHTKNPATGSSMRQISPTIIPRNHLVEAALASAEEGDMQPFNNLFEALQRPYDSSLRNSHFAQPADNEFNEKFRTYCGT